MSKEMRKQINRIKNWKGFLNENYRNEIFYHNSDYDFNEFLKQKKDNKLKRNYLFFSKDINAFMRGKYTYTVELKFNPDKIFNSFKFINDLGLKYTLGMYESDVKKMFSENIDYFYNEWKKVEVDSPDAVLDYFIQYEGGNEQDKLGLLFYFLTKWNDSWVIIETDKFLRFIESKGFSGFVTFEEGILSLGLKDDFKANIIKKENKKV